MYTIKPVGPDGALKVIEMVEFVDSVAAKNIMAMLKAMKEEGLGPEEAARILVQ
jgi:Holliday junction resolvasome RuvABC DNA-binding subunit